MNHRVLIAGLALLTFAATATQTAQALCPGCDAPSTTLTEQVELSAHLLLGKYKTGSKPTAETAGTSTFEIISVAKSRGDLFEAGQSIELPQYIAGKSDGLYILMGPDDKLIDWHIPAEASEDSWQYVSNLPPSTTNPQEQTKRLAYFLKYLEHPEVTVANDAYAEFAIAPYDVITPLKDQLPREKLREWVVDPETPVTRLGLYGILLGQCGNEEDEQAMKETILHPQSEFRLGIEGVMWGYMILGGEDALQVLEDAKLKARTYVNKDGEEVKLPFSETYAVMQALRFMWSHEPDRIPKERLKQSMRILLDRPELADLVIADLARWKDWGVQDRLMAMYDDEEFNIPSVKRAIIRYMYYCSEDLPEEAETPPDYAVTAAKHLATLEQKDPKTYRSAKRFLVR